MTKFRKFDKLRHAPLPENLKKALFSTLSKFFVKLLTKFLYIRQESLSTFSFPIDLKRLD